MVFVCFFYLSLLDCYTEIVNQITYFEIVVRWMSRYFNRRESTKTSLTAVFFCRYIWNVERIYKKDKDTQFKISNYVNTFKYIKKEFSLTVIFNKIIWQTKTINKVMIAACVLHSLRNRIFDFQYHQKNSIKWFFFFRFWVF